MSDELDPEVQADLRLRSSSQYDSSRSRPSATALGTWKPDKPAGMWRCRGRNAQHPCPWRSMVPVTAETIERLMIFNGQLRARGETPIDSGEVVRCEQCRAGIAEARPVILRKRVDDIAALIRKLKESADPCSEREMITQLEKWQHPDVPGLLRAIGEQRSANKGQRVRKESL